MEDSIISNQQKRKTLAPEHTFHGGRMYVCNGNRREAPGCDSIIYVSKDNIFKFVEYGLDMSPEEFYGVICPICGELTKIDINIFPVAYKEYVDKVYNSAQKLKRTPR